MGDRFDRGFLATHGLEETAARRLYGVARGGRATRFCRQVPDLCHIQQEFFANA